MRNLGLCYSNSQQRGCEVTEPGKAVMSENTCPKCGTPYQPYQLVCTKCATLLFDPTSSTLHMRVDPNLLRLRHSHLASDTTLTPEQAISLQIRGLSERVIFEEGTEIILGRVDMSQPGTSRLDLTRYGGHERGVSREHALLRYKGGKLTITDLRSVNGTMRNGQKLNPEQPQEVHDGDELLLGHLSIMVRFEDIPGPKPPAMEDDNEDLTKPLKLSELLDADTAPGFAAPPASGELTKAPEPTANDKGDEKGEKTAGASPDDKPPDATPTPG
jgi:pSer/pThr/pTyr-binding forkhead associated (FHA) protein